MTEDNTIHPGATEVCDGKDNNCNGETDEGVKNAPSTMTIDQDGFGDATNTTQACSAPDGFVSDNTDCDGITDDAVHPGATEDV